MPPEWSQWVRFIAWFFDYLFVEPMMLFPAFSAILLQLCVFKESPIYFKTYQSGAEKRNSPRREAAPPDC